MNVATPGHSGAFPVNPTTAPAGRGFLLLPDAVQRLAPSGAGRCCEGLEEAVGFEPTIPLQVCQFSRLEPSTTRPRFHTVSGLAAYDRLMGDCTQRT